MKVKREREYRKKKADIRGCQCCAKGLDVCQGMVLCAKTKQYQPVVYFCKLPGGYEKPESFSRQQENRKKYRDHSQEVKYARLIGMVPAVGRFTFRECPAADGITVYGWIRALDGMARRGMLRQVDVQEMTERNRMGVRVYEKSQG